MGTCQVCFRIQKLPNGRLSLHGYERPGDGFLYGDCIGSHELPYEESCEITKVVLKSTENHFNSLELQLSKLKNREITEFPWTYVVKSPNYRDQIKKTIMVHIGDSEKPLPDDASWMYTHYRIPSFESLLQDEIRNVERKIQLTSYDITFFKDKIENWSLKPLLPIHEEYKKFAIQFKNLVSEYVFDPKYAWDKTSFNKVGVWQTYRIVQENQLERYKAILEKQKKKMIKAGIIEIQVIPIETPNNF